MRRPSLPRVPARFVVLALLGVIALVVGITGSRYLPMTDTSTADTAAAKKPQPTSTLGPKLDLVSYDNPSFGADPPPTLLDRADLDDVAKLVEAEQSVAARTIKIWWAANGTDIDDDAFVAWAARQLPAAPTADQRRSELPQLDELKSSRSSSGLRAARWLDRNTGADLWQTIRQEQLPLYGSSEDEPSSKELDTAINLASTIAKQVAVQSPLPAPHVVSSALKDTQKATAANAACPCSYPAPAAARGAAARSYLGALTPHRLDQYTWMESQIDAGQLYRADAFPGDISASAFLGDLAGTYVLVTRGHAKP